MNTKTRTLVVLMVAAFWMSLAASDSPTSAEPGIQKAYKGCPRPVCYTRPCDEMYPSGEIKLYDEKSFRVRAGELSIYKEDENEVHNLPSYKISSLRWHLPPGVVVVFYEERKYAEDFPGNQYTVWGKGLDSDLKDDDFDDDMKAWSWHYVGR